MTGATSSLRARLARNLSWTFASQVIISAGAVITLFITARALGPANLGILALVESFVRVVDLILRIEPWQAVMRYAIQAQNRGDDAGFLRLIKLSILIDAVGGVVAALACMILAGFVAPLIGLDPGTGPHYIYLTAFALFFSFRPTATAVLRVFDRFDVLAKIDMASALIRLILTVIAWQAGMGLWAFFVILLVQNLSDRLLCFGFAMREMRRRGHRGVFAANGISAIRENPGILRFMWNSNFNVILRQSANRFDVLVLGAMLNPAAVGMYQLGKRVMNRVVKLAGPVRQTIYPELARLWEQGKVARFNRLIVIVSVSILALQLVVAIPVMLNIERIIEIVFGADFVGAGTVMNILLMSSIIFAAGVALNPALLSMGKDGLLVLVTVVSTLLFALSFLPMVHLFGVEGAALSNLIFNLSWTIGCAFGFQRARG
ncbi:Membrane protein involved in the export of O-antigen and teichoic acid [Paracoccus isoporae]|uniref:Membrane protein involved in the export of O-antigen and teichoic acid n=2 Tax=Paracoccus isoporae TaxID=591205 RepID=A0A1G6UCS9_9RHOB|nr:Membrane protein involved in the export of O-antigen and teichoic acid [Paracoccus isoporae]